MVIFFGTAFYGKIATYKGHWVETKFFHLFYVPLFPVDTIVATEWNFRSRKGWSVNMKSKSVVATYARLFTAGLAGLMFLLGWDSYYGGLTYYLLAVAFSAAWVYFCFFYGKATPEDIVMREKIGSITGMYILPHWLDHLLLDTLLHSYLTKYKTLYPEADWKADLKATFVDKEKRPLLFAIALFNCMVYDLPENDVLYHIANANYVLQPEPTHTPIIALK